MAHVLIEFEKQKQKTKGRTGIERLIHIMMHCPSIAPEAFQLCVQHIHQSRDPSLYQNLLAAYEQLTNNADLNLPNMMELAELDVKWADETIAKNQTDRIKLEVELKTYSNNMIKESIRVRLLLKSYLFPCDINPPPLLLVCVSRWHIAILAISFVQLVIMVHL